MRANHPDVRALGPLLSEPGRARGHVQLLDSIGNPADELNYIDDRPWPDFADGGGASLELRDLCRQLHGRNRGGRAWNRRVPPGATTLIGPLRRAPSVRRSGRNLSSGCWTPGSAWSTTSRGRRVLAATPVSMLQNGSFRKRGSRPGAPWEHRASRVEPDPDNPANHVLHLIATGPPSTCTTTWKRPWPAGAPS